MLRRLLADSTIYTAATAFPGIAGLLLLPIYTRYVRAADYGLIDLVTFGYSVIAVLASLEVSQGLARFLPEATDFNTRRRLSSTALWLTVLPMLLAVLATWAFAPAIAAFWLLNPDFAPIWQIGGITALLGAAYGISLRHLRGSLRPRAYLIATILTTIIGAITTLVLLHDGRGPVALLLGQATGSAAGFTAVCLLAGGELAWTWDRVAAKQMLTFSGPLVLSTLGVLLMVPANRWIVAHLTTLESAGHFGIATRIASMLGFAASGLQLSLSPLIYASRQDPGTPVALADSFRVFVAGALVLWIALTLFSSEIVALLTSAEFQDAGPLVGPMAAAVLITASTMFAPGLEIALRTIRAAAVRLLAGFLGFGLAWWWTTWWGVVGTVFAMCVSASALAVVIFRLSDRHLPVPHRWPRLLGAVAIAAASSFPLWSLPFFEGQLTWLLRSAVLVVAGLGIGYLLLAPVRAQNTATGSIENGEANGGLG